MAVSTQAHDAGMGVGFNLNILQGRWPQYTEAIQHRSKVPSPADLAPWDSRNARALLEYTVNEVPEALWPVPNVSEWQLRFSHFYFPFSSFRFNVIVVTAKIFTLFFGKNCRVSLAVHDLQ
jgi:hypothetical protein